MLGYFLFAEFVLRFYLVTHDAALPLAHTLCAMLRMRRIDMNATCFYWPFCHSDEDVGLDLILSRRLHAKKESKHEKSKIMKTCLHILGVLQGGQLTEAHALQNKPGVLHLYVWCKYRGHVLQPKNSKPDLLTAGAVGKGH